jgi:hypothetical protein
MIIDIDAINRQLDIIKQSTDNGEILSESDKVELEEIVHNITVSYTDLAKALIVFHTGTPKEIALLDDLQTVADLYMNIQEPAAFEVDEKDYLAVDNLIELATTLDNIFQLANAIILKGGLNVIKQVNHQFQPCGYTALYLLAESHMSFHTYPEKNV